MITDLYNDLCDCAESYIIKTETIIKNEESDFGPGTQSRSAS